MLKTVYKVRSTLGLLNYHYAFVPGFSHIVKPLTQLLKKDTPFLWTTTCTNVLNRVIELLTTAPVLTYPNPDLPFELEVDASNYATGAILFQRDHRGKPRPIGFPSNILDIIDYIRGCAKCQATKPRTNTPKAPIHPIPPEHSTIPFATIALDFITKLPLSNGQDTILTITDHDCSKAALFFPCKETITAEEVAKLYATQVFPHYGIPLKVISDQDARFTGHFTRTLCEKLQIKQNLSMAFHPQTDGQSERTNQWLEQYLRLFTN
jgi:hypothetical protein